MKRKILLDYRGHRSQAEMATKYNVSQQSWSKWETGKKSPTPDKMKQLEDDIGVPMEEIFADVFFNNSKGHYA